MLLAMTAWPPRAPLAPWPHVLELGLSSAAAGLGTKHTSDAAPSVCPALRGFWSAENTCVPAVLQHTFLQNNIGLCTCAGLKGTGASGNKMGMTEKKL